VNINPNHIVRRVTVVGLIFNAVLIAVKLAAGMVGDSQALLADAIHSSSDFVAGVAVLAGSYFWSKKPDSSHPYGHKKIETLLSIGIGLSLFFAAFIIGMEALKSIQEGSSSTPDKMVIWAAAVSLLVKEGLYKYTIIYARKVKSQALKASALDHRSDAISSIPVLVSVALASYAPGWGFVDSVGALIVVVFICHSAIQIIKPAFAEIMDNGAAKEVCDKIMSEAKKIHGVHGVHDLRTRYSGSELYVDLHIVLNPLMPLWEAHTVGNRVEIALKSKEIGAFDVLVHLDPYDDSGD
jgi:cation diffusion facilitator family transporter